MPDTFTIWMKKEQAGTLRANLTLKLEEFDDFIQYIINPPRKAQWQARSIRVHTTHPEHGHVCLTLRHVYNNKGWTDSWDYAAFRRVGEGWKIVGDIQRRRPFMAVAAVVASLLEGGNIG